MEYKEILPEITLKYKKGNVQKHKINDSNTAYNVLKKLYDSDIIEYCEVSIVLFLNKANNTISWFKLSQGGISGTIIDKRMLFAAALKCGATSFIISHNHPSGNNNPSDNDIAVTKEIKSAGLIMNIQLLDHIIVCKDSYYSLADNGNM